MPKNGKQEKAQLKLVLDWNGSNKIGTKVKVTKDDNTTIDTVTSSNAYMLGKSGDYIGHTAVIGLAGISGCYELERVQVI